MAKEYKGDALPACAAAQGNPQGLQAADDVMFKGAKVVTKGEYYNWRYLAEIDAGCAEQAAEPEATESQDEGDTAQTGSLEPKIEAGRRGRPKAEENR